MSVPTSKQKVPWFVAIREENTRLRQRVIELEQAVMYYVESEKMRGEIFATLRALTEGLPNPWEQRGGHQ
ncbi:MAG: hypothetical protein RLZZ142_2051 [Verrucomicrobiota bacterium]|jgi:hypothetical protein